MQGMLNDNDSGFVTQMLHQAACSFDNAAIAQERVYLEQKRPFMLLKPRIYPDGNMWCALYGDNIQEGVAGFGETPEKASIDFDIQWLNQRMTNHNNERRVG